MLKNGCREYNRLYETGTILKTNINLIAMISTGKSNYLYLLGFAALLVLQNCSQATKSETGSINESPAGEYYTMDDFKSVRKVDAHIHVRTGNTDFIEQAIADNFHLLNIDVYKEGGPSVEEQRDLALLHMKAFPQHISYATTFSLENWESEQWAQQAIDHLETSFSKGAIGVKVWKNIGMEFRDKDDNFVMIDNPKFKPVFDFIAENDITLLSHQGEPRECWLPLEEMTFHKGYFSQHPEYHMYLHPEFPSYEDQIVARDNMLAENPGLRVVSVHLASLEWSVDEMAKRLDKFPNMAIDIAARIKHLQYQAKQDRQRVYDFFIKYQDRLLYATDIVITEERAKNSDVKKDVHERWLDDWKFFVTDDLITTPGIEGEYKGLKLPREVVDKFYRLNAEKWFPGLGKDQQTLAATRVVN